VTENLAPATGALTELLAGVRDEHLTAPTPCDGITVGDLPDHVDSLCRTFTAAATKTHLPDGGAAPIPDATRLGPDWRDRLPARLTDLAAAWRAEPAWTGETESAAAPCRRRSHDPGPPAAPPGIKRRGRGSAACTGSRRGAGRRGRRPARRP
jgi:uncharacterized protein (TIGR03086 family)